MTNWEYLHLYITTTTQVGKGHETEVVYDFYSNGVKTHVIDKKIMKIHELLNQMGKEGWEMVNVFYNKNDNLRDIYMKRPLE